MTTFPRRSVLAGASAGLLALAAGLGGCGKKDAPAAPATPAAAASAPAAGTAAPLMGAFAYIGPGGDGGWTFSHDNGR